jgi:hypothetical protein
MYSTERKFVMMYVSKTETTHAGIASSYYDYIIILRFLQTIGNIIIIMYDCQILNIKNQDKKINHNI